MMLEFTIRTASTHAEDLRSQLIVLGAVAITTQDAGDQPLFELKPGDAYEWNEIVLTAFYEDHSLLEAIKIFLTQQLQQNKLEFFTVQEVVMQDWVAATQKYFSPMRFGKRLWICPSWHEPPDPDALIIFLDPGLAFGTGTHPTTALCLEWLDANITHSDTVMDYGCGSGILALAALKLGADKVIAVDHDPAALEICRENARQNAVSENQLDTYLPENVPHHPVDIIVANILANPLIDLAKQFRNLLMPNGRLILSGILQSDSEKVLHAYQSHYHLISSIEKDGWMRFEFKLRDH